MTSRLLLCRSLLALLFSVAQVISLCATLSLAQTTSPAVAQPQEAIRALASELLTAKSAADRALILSSRGDTAGLPLFDEIMRRAGQYSLEANLDAALFAFTVAREVALKVADRQAEGEALMELGGIRSRQGQNENAIELRMAALAIFEATGNTAKQADALNNIGIIYRRQDKYDLALEYYTRSLELREPLGDKEKMASTLTNMGVVHNARGEALKALSFHQRALSLRSSIKDSAILGSILNNLGTVHTSLGEYVAAIGYLTDAQSVAAAANDRFSESIYIRNAGSAYTGMGDYRRALECQLKGLELIAGMGDKLGISTAYNNIGFAYSRLGNYELALDYFERSKRLREEIKNRAGVATNLRNIGRVYFLRGEADRAIAGFQEALRIREEIKTRDGIARVLIDLGEVMIERGEFAAAEDGLLRAISIFESLGDRPGLAESSITLARARYRAKDLQGALQSASRAAGVAAKIGNIEFAWQAQNLLGQIHLALDNPAEAQANFEAAIAAIERLREGAGGERERGSFFENKLAPYHAMADMLAAAGRAAEALAYAERGRARVLLDIIQRGRANISGEMTSAEVQQEREHRAELTALNLQIMRESQRAQPDAARIAELEKRLADSRLAFGRFRSNLYAVHPDLKAARAEFEPLTNAQLLTLLADERTAALEYLVKDDKTLLFVVTRRGASVSFRSFTIPVPGKELAARANRFRDLIAAREPFEAEARELFGLLLKPARAALSGKTSLVIVPDNALWSVPFQALQPRPGRFLLEDAAVSYAPSLTALAAMAARRERRRTAAEKNLLAIGNPARSEVERDLLNPLRNEGPLADAEREVSVLAKLYGASRSRVYTGSDAREDRIKAEAPQFRILQFATHGVIDDTSPMYSRILLASPEASSAEDGLLEAWEMMDLDLNARMVVLSACETARGRVSGGEGILGMSWALFVAGSPATVASHWKVSSRTTAEIMTEFHRQLILANRTHTDMARALQRASLNQLRRGAFRHPFYWAGFVVIGDTGALRDLK